VFGLAQYAAFAGVSLAVICTPGQDTALTIRNTLAGGRRAGVATAFGVAAGQATWTVATGAGLAVVLMASAPLFFVVRLAGAAYLIYLGTRSLLRSLPPIRGEEARLPHLWGSGAVRRRWGRAAGAGAAGARGAFAQGYLSNLSNAKMVAFFVSLLPPFAGPHPSFILLLALGFNFCLLTLAWLTAYAFAVERMRRWLGLSTVRKTMDGLLGAVLVGLGLRVGSEALAA